MDSHSSSPRFNIQRVKSRWHVSFRPLLEVGEEVQIQYSTASTDWPLASQQHVATATSEKIELRSLRVSAENRVNLQKQLGLSKDPIIQNVKLRVRLDADVPRATVERIVKLAEERCPALTHVPDSIEQVSIHVGYSIEHIIRNQASFSDEILELLFQRHTYRWVNRQRRFLSPCQFHSLPRSAQSLTLVVSS